MSLERDELELEQIRAAISKTMAETAKIQQEMRWHWPVACSTIIIALLAAGKYLL